MKQVTKCTKCGKEYKQMRHPVTKQLRDFFIPDCKCEELESELKTKQKEEKMRREALQKTLNKKFNNSMMTPYFLKKKFENLEKTDAVIFGIKYAEEFNQQSSKGISIIGNIGLGKSTLFACICNELIRKSFNCLFLTMSELLDMFINSCDYKNDDSSEKILTWLVKFDFIVLDDIGQESYTPRKKEFFFRIIDTLMKNNKVVGYTANIKLYSKLEADVEIEATLDRLKEMCPINIVFEGNSYRGSKITNGN